MQYSVEEIKQYAAEEDVKFIRMAFCDAAGRQKNIAIMPEELDRAFQYGIAIDGSAIPGFGGEVLRVDGCCCILFTGESDAPGTVKQMLLDEIARIRAEGVDREIFTLCKNEKYGQLIENLENVEDSASQMADFALSGQTVAQQITTLASLTAEDADHALRHILQEERMAVLYIQPDGTVCDVEAEEEEE